LLESLGDDFFKGQIVAVFVENFRPRITTIQDVINLSAFVSTGWSGRFKVLANPSHPINES
jgi:hypothetical protein